MEWSRPRILDAIVIHDGRGGVEGGRDVEGRIGGGFAGTVRRVEALPER